jgi:hypothetical protein
MSKLVFADIAAMLLSSSPLFMSAPRGLAGSGVAGCGVSVPHFP